MIRLLAPDTFQQRAEFLADVRAFFRERDALEVETPLLNATGAVEPFLDSFVVKRPAESEQDRKTSGPARRQAGYLITSPEYNLKILLAHLDRDLFQIAHTFRSGESGGMHTEEFLMLEWYRRGIDEFQLMDECDALLAWLAGRGFSRLAPPPPAERLSVAELLDDHAGCDSRRAGLLDAVQRHGLATQDPADWRYDELFFCVFLNLVEPKLAVDWPVFVYNYPPELAALSRVEDGVARRFEIYWHGVELANGYFELTDPAEQRARFARENDLRRSLNKEPMPIDEQFLEAISGMPPASGVALGLDRLFMVLRGETDFSATSPFL